MRVPGIRVLLVATALTVAFADIAAAQAPPPPTYGGGRLVQAEPLKTYAPSVNLSLQPRGSQIAMLFDSSVSCGGRPIDIQGGDEVAWDGTNFSFQGSGRVALRRRGRLDYTWTVTGQISGGTGTGTLHVTGVRRRGGKARKCTRKADRAFVVKHSAALAGGPAMPAPRAFYAGTSDFEIFDRIHSPVILRATKDGKRIAGQWTIATKCGRGRGEAFVNFSPPMRVRPDGTFSRKERFSVEYGTELVRYRATFSGRIHADGATGTMRLRTRVYNRRGTKLRTRCDSGNRIWIVTPA
jgi:hypothetical protein